MVPISNDNKRIAKNTLYMYFRMFITMGVSLYTSRVILSALGADDYGLYNVVGGIVAMFGFISGAMTNTTSRYITFNLGLNDPNRLRNVFSMAVIIHIALALLILLLGETIGLWYLKEKLVIPEGREYAAAILYQLSIASAIVNLLYLPFNSAIIAHEKMGTFAFISILDAFLKLAICFFVKSTSGDKLIFYGVLLFAIYIIDITIYTTYCFNKFKETKLHWFFDRQLFKEMFGFAGWSLFGNFSYVFYSQGINLMLNAFFGTAVNAARGIAVQVESVITNFANNVQTAINPQIIKSYADSHVERMTSLIFASSRFCFFLLFALTLPIVLEADFILELWLVNVPQHTVNFIRITLSMATLNALSNPLFTANLASGKVRVYQITLSCISYAMMPITYFALKFSEMPEMVFICLFICKIIEQIARIFVFKSQIGIPVKSYVKSVIFPVLLVFLISVPFPIVCHCILNTTTINSIFVIFTSFVSVVIFSFLFGMEKDERKYIIVKLKGMTQKYRIR